jgi:hypothetical protein
VLKKPRSPLRPVKVTIHPDEGPPGRPVMRRWVLSLGQAGGGDENPYRKSVQERAKISRAFARQASVRVPTWHAKVRAPRTSFEILKLKLS